MNTGRSRRSRPPTGKTNLSAAASTFIGGGKTAGYAVPVSPTKGRSLRPFTPDAPEPSHEETHAKRFGHFLEAPAVRHSGLKTRSELLAARRHSRAHFYDRYDLDGDGVVDPYEVRLGALVDLDGNGEISQDEKDYLKDLIESGKLKEISFLKDKAGGDAKKCLTWVGSREWTRQQAEAAAARDARVARMKQGHSSKKDAVTALAGIAASAIVPEDDSSLLDHLASSLDPFKDQALQRALRGNLHPGRGPMDRVMPGRQTPSMEYKPAPLVRTRSELLATRRAALRDSMSYDLDGDGNVDPIEHMVASLLDVNKDGTLSAEEKAKTAALVEKLRKYYITGLDSQGTNTQGIRIHQRDGRVMSDMTTFDAGEGVGDVFASEGVDEGTPTKPSSGSVGEERTGRLSSPFFRLPASPLRTPVLSRAGSSSLADDLRRSVLSPSVRPAATAGGGEVLRLPGSSRPGTGMSHLLGL